MKCRWIGNERGVALVIALIVSLAVMAMVTGMLYFTDQSTKISGAGRAYATADQAADGAVDVLKDTINLTLLGVAPADLFAAGGLDHLQSAILATSSPGAVETATLTLPDSLGGHFTATVSVQRLFSVSLPGSRLEFARSGGSVASTAIYFRITAKVVGPNNKATAESSALYRFAG
jgi:Tfp pilus assembly protein PilX